MGGIANNMFQLGTIMLWLVLAFLLLTNSRGFTRILNSFGSQWTSTLRVLQGRD